jgi:hypothetical protein
VAFTRLFTLAREGRLKIPPGAEVLIEELKILRHTIGDTGIPRFSAAGGRHDDTVFALAWAAHALAGRTWEPLRFLYPSETVQSVAEIEAETAVEFAERRQAAIEVVADAVKRHGYFWPSD